MTNALHAFRAVWIAESCPACNGPSDAGFCTECALELPRIERPCPICALPLPAAHCPRQNAEWRVSRVVAPFRYAPPLDTYLQRLKFGNGRMFGRALSLAVARTLEHAGAAAAAEGAVLVPVPLHRRRLLARGYNQATEIAVALARALGLDCAHGAATRRRPVVPQSRLGARARRANVAEAFAVSHSIRGRSVVIIDDVITTGATINALAAALLEAGAQDVAAWAVARTP